ncbi:glutamine amidotransferase [Alienimonas sp. DA493]|uniref:glutamine amidotransferase n=1 Tax=Alienimonas sp. DA493 TaxID=3373605 RepID=UPI00375523F4
MTLALNPAWSLPLTLLCGAALVGLVLWTYPPRVRHLSPGVRRTLLGLRLAAAVLLTVALLRPELRREETETERPAILVLADVSRSMTIADGPGGASRFESMRSVLAAAAPALAELGEDLEVFVATFDAARNPPPEEAEGAGGAGEAPDPLSVLPEEPSGDRTALGAVLGELVRSDADLSSVVLLTDAAQRALPPDDADPRAAGALLAESGVRVYGVPFGSDGAVTAGFDLSVEDLRVDPVVFEKKRVPVSGVVRIVGGAGREFTVRLLTESPPARGPGDETELVPVEPSGDARPVTVVRPTQGVEEIPVELTFVPQTAGEMKLALQIEPVEGELKQTNNQRATVLSVRKGGIRVLYFDRLRPEVNALRRVNLSNKIQLDYVELPANPNALSPGLRLEAALFEPGRYDAFIIGDVAAEAFREGNDDFLDDLAARVEDGAGLMMTGGLNSFGPGGWGRTALRNVLPVELPRGGAVDDFDPRNQIAGEVPMIPTRQGAQNYVMLLADPAENAEVWRNLPPLEGANRLELKRNVPADVLAVGPDDVPLLIAAEYGRSRVLAFAGDTTWLWPLSGFEAEHARFWRQVVLWLTRKEEDTDGPVFVVAEPRNVVPGRPARLKLGARDAEGEPVPDAQFTVEVTAPDGEVSTLSPRVAGPANPGVFRAEAADTDAPGDYWVRVRATAGSGDGAGTLLGPDAVTRFVVDPRDLELDNPAADPALLADLARTTGGSVVPPEELPAFLARWAEEPPAAAESTVLSRTPLYDKWWVPLIFVGLMGTEWYLRKKRGLV